MRTLLLVALLCLVGTPVDAADDDDALTWARGVLKERLPLIEAAPEFATGRQWLNVSRPLSLAKDLRGKVVILDFWCYCCINCIHVLPDLEYLEAKYEDEPFAVVGVHSAKFDNEKDANNIREAIRRYEIQHPVVNDGDFRIWRAYGARSWPTFAVITPDGKLLGLLSGEGRRKELDALVQVLLEHYRPGKTRSLPIQLEDAKRQAGTLAYPGKIAVDAARDSLFIADSNHNRIVEVSTGGTFKRAWGDGPRGLRDGGPVGTKAAARFFRPQGMALRGDELWVADTSNHALRVIDLATGAVRTVAGDGTQGRALRGSFEAAQAQLASPWALLWRGDQLVIAMAGPHQLWQYDPQRDVVELYAGDGTERRLDAQDLREAAFAQPSGLALHDGVIYVADSESSAIVAVGPDGVTTLAGANENPRDLFHYGDDDGQGRGRRFQHCLGVAVVGDTLFVADSYNHKIKTVALKGERRGTVDTYLGNGTPGFRDMPARFSEPGGLAVHGTTLYVADTNNHAIRIVDTKTRGVRTLKLEGAPIPQMHARGRTAPATDWPTLADTETSKAREIVIQAHGRTPVTVELRLPLGWKLTEGAPSAMRIEVGDEVRDLEIAGGKTEGALPSLLPGDHEGAVRLLYYVCQDEGSCRVRSVTFPLKVRARESVESHPGIVLQDTFVP